MVETAPEPAPYSREPYNPAVVEYVQKLRPAETVAMLRSAKQAVVDRVASGATPGSSRLLCFELFAAVSWLPEVNLPLAREVYQGLSESPDEDDRETGANLVSALTPFDHDFGLTLWRNLARDPSDSVRGLVETELDFLLDGDHPKREASLEDLRGLEKKGITFDEACELLRLTDEAERTEQFYDPGAIALQGAQRVLWGPSISESPVASSA
jgi:hypothetical protein